MIFDLATTIRTRRQVNRAKKALLDLDWASLAHLLADGLSPNQVIPLGMFANKSIFGDTTIFLELSKHPVRLPSPGAPPSHLYQVFRLALEKGGDVSVRAPCDMRGPITHQANIQNLDGWKMLSEYGLINYHEVVQLASDLGWSEGRQWAASRLAHEAAEDLHDKTPKSPSGRPSPRL